MNYIVSESSLHSIEHTGTTYGLSGFAGFNGLSARFEVVACSRNDRFCLVLETDLLARCLEKLSLC